MTYAIVSEKACAYDVAENGGDVCATFVLRQDALDYCVVKNAASIDALMVSDALRSMTLRASRIKNTGTMAELEERDPDGFQSPADRTVDNTLALWEHRSLHGHADVPVDRNEDGTRKRL